MRARKRKRNAANPVPHTRAAIEIPNEFRWTRTDPPRNSYLLDTGDQDESRILAFASEAELRRLAQWYKYFSNNAYVCISYFSNVWLIDGTFDCAPNIYRQLWVIHGRYGNRVLPFVFVLLPDKSEHNYRRALAGILDIMDQMEPGIFSTIFKSYHCIFVLNFCLFLQGSITLLSLSSISRSAK